MFGNTRVRPGGFAFHPTKNPFGDYLTIENGAQKEKYVLAVIGSNWRSISKEYKAFLCHKSAAFP